MYDWEIEQMDVVTAFFGDIDSTILVSVPEGYDTYFPHNTKALLLKKALYGTKQGSRCWHQTLRSRLVKHGFLPLNTNSSIFIKRQDAVVIIIVTYVDDLLITGQCPKLINATKKLLSKEFDMKDLGPIDVFLGMKIIRDRDKRTMIISQVEYIAESLVKFNMQDSNPVATPTSSNPLGVNLDLTTE